MGFKIDTIMLVSVIIPAYNSIKTIDKTLQSVFDQNYKDIEIIVINDGSTDGTLEKLREYKDEIHLFSQENSGVSAARNFGFKKSKGDYIQYLDADDILAKDKINIQVNALIDNNADVAYGDWQKFKNDFNSEIQYLELISRSIKGRPEIELFSSFWCPLAAILYSRSMCNKIGGWKVNLPIIQDARYFLDAALHNAKLIYTPGVMAYYHVHESGSLSTNNKLKFINDCFTNAKEIYMYWKDDLNRDLEKKNAIIDVLRYCINEFSRIDYKAFNECIDMLLEIEPNYLPKKSASMNMLSKILGYRYAEYIAAIKRRLT